MLLPMDFIPYSTGRKEKLHKKGKIEKLSRYSLSSSVTTTSVGRPFAARLATSPSLVEGV
jgi:hypothetical protein